MALPFSKYFPGIGKSVEMRFLDDENLYFGDAKDVAIGWDGSDLNILPLANDTGAIKIGNGALDMDLKVFLGAVGKYVELNVGASALNVVGVPVKVTPTSQQAIGVQVVSQCVQAFKYECSLSAQQGAWVHGVKVEVTRSANIQPATGAWFGAQFVLNAGSAGYDALNKDAYVVQAVFKGSDTTPNGQDIHVGRFEIQSAGKVSDIVHILANTGCTVIGHLLYIASHINANGALINVQSAATMAKALSFMAGAGATLTSLLYASGDGTFTNFLEVSATGKGGVTVAGGGMTKAPKNDDEDGFITIKVGATPYQVPIYAE